MWRNHICRWVAAFSISAYGSSNARASHKPFNPLLGETFECIREDKGFRYVAEQVDWVQLGFCWHMFPTLRWATILPSLEYRQTAQAGPGARLTYIIENKQIILCWNSWLFLRLNLIEIWKEFWSIWPRRWNIQVLRIRSKFWGKSMEFQPEGEVAAKYFIHKILRHIWNKQ